METRKVIWRSSSSLDWIGKSTFRRQVSIFRKIQIYAPVSSSGEEEHNNRKTRMNARYISGIKAARPALQRRQLTEDDGELSRWGTFHNKSGVGVGTAVSDVGHHAGGLLYLLGLLALFKAHIGHVSNKNESFYKIFIFWPDLTWPDLTWPDLTWPDYLKCLHFYLKSDWFAQWWAGDTGLTFTQAFYRLGSVKRGDKNYW